MKKKLVVLLTFVLALTAALCVVSACKSKKGAVEVTVSPTSLEMTVGDSKKVTATVNDDEAEILWTSSDESVATVTNGTVKALKAGSATITATASTDEKASASCSVTVKDKTTFVFKNADNEEITEATVERDGTLQLRATASDGSEITSWTSSDTEIATVNSTGLVTGLYEGDVTITVKTATGSGTIKVTVEDNFDGVKYTLIDKDEKAVDAGQWWYYISLDGYRTTKVIKHAEFRGDVITFDFEADNWYKDDVQLGYKQPTTDTETGWRKVTATIKSDFKGTVTIFETPVSLVEGDNEIEVAYDQSTTDQMFLVRFSSDAGFISSGKVVISNLTWEAHTVKDLETPSFTLTDDTIAITDNENTEGVAYYQIGLFLMDDGIATDPTHTQNFTIDGGDLDVSRVETNGNYVVRIKAVAQPGYNSSEWSTDNSVTYVIKNEALVYDIPYGGETDAISSKLGQWVYWTGDGGALVSGKTPNYNAGTVTIDCIPGSAWYGIQLFYHNASFSTGESIKISMNINASAAGWITIHGVQVYLNEGDNTVAVACKQDGSATIGIQIGTNDQVNIVPDNEKYANGTEYTFTFSNIKIERYNAPTLEAPSVTVSQETDEEDESVTVNIANITDPNEEGVGGYEIGFFKSEAETSPVRSVKVTNGGAIDDSKVEDGNYFIRVRAIAESSLYASSAWSETAVAYEVANGGIQLAKFEPNYVSQNTNYASEGDVVGEGDTQADKFGVWWMAGSWGGAVTTLSGVNFDAENKEISVTYAGGSVAHNVQIFYKNSALTLGESYTLTLNVCATEALKVIVNGKEVSLEKGVDTAITVDIASMGGTSFSIQLAGTEMIDGADSVSVKISNIVWTEA